MGGSAGKRRKQYVYRLKVESKTCLIHGPVHSSGECKVLIYFGTKYAKVKSTNDHGNHPVARKKLTGSSKITLLLIMW